MTIFQPNYANTALHRVLILLICALIASAAMLVVYYNRYTNAEHGIAEANAELQQIETENAEMKRKILELVSGARVDELVAERQLVKDRQPRYLEARNGQWSIASQ